MKSETRIAGRTYAQLGMRLPGPITREVVARHSRSPIANSQSPIANGQDQGQARNLMGWIVPQAQTRWLAAGVAWYTPQRCEAVFRQALAGDLQSQWEMFDLMEATWPELLTCLGQLKDEVIGSDIITLQPFARRGQKPSDEAVNRHRLVQECLDTMRPRPDRDENDFEDSVRDLLDARGKGISLLEVDWESKMLASDGTGGDRFVIAPRCTRWVHPLWYGYPHGPGSGELMLRPGANGDPKKTYFPGDTSVGYGGGGSADWQEFPEHKFVIGVCKSRTGHPLASGLLHALTFWWAAFNFTAEWFFVFAQINGQPFRWATYDPNMTPTDQMKLQAVLANMGANAWGMFPQGTTFELKEVAKAAGDNPNVALLNMANKCCRLLILRQTLTADVGDQGGGSKALGEVHERVEGGVILACGRWAGRTLNQLARAICVLNYGDDRECPWFGPEEEGEDVAGLADALYKASQAGLEPTDEAIPELGERLGYPVQRKAAPAPQGETALNGKEQIAKGKPVEAEAGRGAREVVAMQSHAADALGVPAGWLNPLKEFLLELERKAGDQTLSDADLITFLEKAAERVPELFHGMDVEELARVMEAGMGKAVMDGVRQRLRQKPGIAK